MNTEIIKKVKYQSCGNIEELYILDCPEVKKELKKQAKNIFDDLLKESMTGDKMICGTLEIANNKLIELKEKYGLKR